MQHMLDKNHTRIGTETLTRRGNYDPEGTESIQAELEDFFDCNATQCLSRKLARPRVLIWVITGSAELGLAAPLTIEKPFPLSKPLNHLNNKKH